MIAHADEHFRRRDENGRRRLADSSRRKAGVWSELHGATNGLSLAYGCVRPSDLCACLATVAGGSCRAPTSTTKKPAPGS